MTIFKYYYILIIEYIKQELLSIMNVEDYSDIFKALAHPVRLKIALGLMTKENCNVNTMSEKLKIAQPTVSQYLTVLKNSKVIVGQRKGNQICYKIENEQVKRILSGMEVDICEQ